MKLIMQGEGVAVGIGRPVPGDAETLGAVPNKTRFVNIESTPNREYLWNGSVWLPLGAAEGSPTETVQAPDILIRNEHVAKDAKIDWMKLDKTGALPEQVGAAPSTRQVLTGRGLKGGGQLTGDLTLEVVSGSTVQRVQLEKDGKTLGSVPILEFKDSEQCKVSVAVDGDAAVLQFFPKAAVPPPAAGRTVTSVSTVSDPGISKAFSPEDHKHALEKGSVRADNIVPGALSNIHLADNAAVAWSKIDRSGAKALDVGAVANGGGAHSLGVGNTLPPAGIPNRLFAHINDLAFYLDTGSTWRCLGPIFKGAVYSEQDRLKIAAGAVGTSELANGSITADKISKGAGIAWGNISKAGSCAEEVQAVPLSRAVKAGKGLRGGGVLAQDLTFEVQDDSTVQRVAVISGTSKAVRSNLVLVAEDGLTIQVQDDAKMNTAIIRISSQAAALANVSSPNDGNGTGGIATTASRSDHKHTTVDGSVANAHLAQGAVTADKIAPKSLGNEQIADGAKISWSKVDKDGAVARDIGAVSVQAVGRPGGLATLDDSGQLNKSQAAGLRVPTGTIIQFPAGAPIPPFWISTEVAAVAEDYPALATLLGVEGGKIRLPRLPKVEGLVALVKT